MTDILMHPEFVDEASHLAEVRSITVATNVPQWAIAPAKAMPKKRKKERHQAKKDRDRNYQRLNARFNKLSPSINLNGHYPTYSSFLADIRLQKRILPPAQFSRTALPAFPTVYRSPQEVPKGVQQRFSAFPFFYSDTLVYRWDLGHALHIVTRSEHEMGCFVKEFKDNDGNRELFYKDSLTGGYHYLGQFRFVMSRAFPYGRKECGRIPEIARAPVQPTDGPNRAEHVFVVLQFVKYNLFIYGAFTNP